MSKRSARRSQDGTAPQVGLFIGIMVFAIVFFFITQATYDEAGTFTPQNEEDNYQSSARALTAALLSTGSGWYDGAACDDDEPNEGAFEPDLIGTTSGGRLGLADEGCGRDSADASSINNLSFAKLANLASVSSDGEADPDNGKVDYDEARASLGLEGSGLDFKLRTWPVFGSAATTLADGTKDPHLRPLYIGHYEQLVDTRQITKVDSVTDAADQVTLKVSVTNNGTGPTVIGVTFRIPLAAQTVEVPLYTPVLLPAQSHEVTLKLRKTSDWTWADPTNKVVSYGISDPGGEFQQGSISLAAVTMTYASARPNLVVYPTSDYFLRTGASVVTQVEWKAFNGVGNTLNHADWTLRHDAPPLGLPIYTDVLPNDDQGVTSRTMVTVGTYTGKLYNDLMTLLWNEAVINVVLTEVSEFNEGPPGYAPADSTIAETLYLEALVEEFSRNVASLEHASLTVPYAVDGSILPDDTDTLEDLLTDRLEDDLGAPSIAEHNVLIIGSDVDGDQLDTAALRDAINDWVEAGGTLIVFGSENGDTHWLQPLVNAELQDVTGDVNADPMNPILSSPNDLDYIAFATDREWDYQGASSDNFEHVIWTADDRDVLGISKNGAYEGHIILTSWRPYVLTEDQEEACPDDLDSNDPCQALYLMHNAIAYAYDGLYIDFGPTPADTQIVGGDLRIVTVWHPGLQQSIQVAMQVQVFAGSG